jgi:multidrug efflux pump subunit AcrA (membrane-fusion protein)
MPTTVTEVANLHPAQHTCLVKLAIPAAPDLRSGLFGRARFAGATRAVIQAPANAVVRRGQLAFAFVVAADGAARLRMVSAGDTWNDRIEIQSGLQPGDLVVVSPPAGLGDGTRVRREPASNPAGV